MLSSQIDQQERKEILRNDQRVREQGSTFHAFAQADAELPGRFGAISKTQIVGANALPIYPAASAHQYDPCGPEPALGFSVEEMIPVGSDCSSQGPGPAEATTGQGVAHAAGLSALGPVVSVLPAQVTGAPVSVGVALTPTPLGGSAGASFSSRRSYRRF
jgi:hypothetical protein